MSRPPEYPPRTAIRRPRFWRAAHSGNSGATVVSPWENRIACRSMLCRRFPADTWRRPRGYPRRRRQRGARIERMPNARSRISTDGRVTRVHLDRPDFAIRDDRIDAEQPVQIKRLGQHASNRSNRLASSLICARGQSSRSSEIDAQVAPQPATNRGRSIAELRRAVRPGARSRHTKRRPAVRRSPVENRMRMRGPTDLLRPNQRPRRARPIRRRKPMACEAMNHRAAIRRVERAQRGAATPAFPSAAATRNGSRTARTDSPLLPCNSAQIEQAARSVRADFRAHQYRSKARRSRRQRLFQSGRIVVDPAARRARLKVQIAETIGRPGLEPASNRRHRRRTRAGPDDQQLLAPTSFITKLCQQLCDFPMGRLRLRND